MKICWFGIYHREYSRNQVLISGLQQQGVEIVECNMIGGKGIEKYWELIKKIYAIDNQYDYLFCAFPINYNVLIAKFFQRKKVVIDAFFPLYDAYVHDRKLLFSWSPRALLYYCLDRINLRLADLVITDTEQHAQYWKKLHPEVSVHVIPVGSYTKEFFPISESSRKNKDNLLVSFHGSYIPLQGVHKILEAAESLKNQKQIRFRLIGPRRMIEELDLNNTVKYPNVEAMSWLKTKELNERLNEADIILGIFGNTPKTDRVVPNKLFQGVAVLRPVITKDTPAIRELFTEREVYMIENTPEALAGAIIEMYNHPGRRQEMAEQAYSKYLREFTEDIIGRKLLKAFSFM
jgi:glycosyltransferase involved in cell wall biosynthesis